MAIGLPSDDAPFSRGVFCRPVRTVKERDGAGSGYVDPVPERFVIVVEGVGNVAARIEQLRRVIKLVYDLEIVDTSRVHSREAKNDASRPH